MEIINRKAKFEYEILDKFEAGIVLTGTEIKSVRNGNANIKDSYAIIKNGEVFLLNMFISEYKEGNMEEGLFPEKDNWYYNAIKTYTDPETGRYLRYLDGEYAEKLWNISHFLEEFNEKRNYKTKRYR